MRKYEKLLHTFDEQMCSQFKSENNNKLMR